MRFGTLRLKLPSGERQEFPLEQPTLVIGRASDNALIVEDSSVSRRHARLTVDSGRLMVEDLGSANGTFLGGRRLPPNTPSLVADGQTLRLGDVQIEYDAPPAVEAASAFAPPPAVAAANAPSAAPAGPAISAALTAPLPPVAPGALTTTTLTLHNRGAVVDEFSLAVGGVPAEWVKFSQARVPLLPNAQQTVTLSVQPPRRPEAAAGEHRLTITVSAKEHGTQLELAATLLVLPFHQVTLGLQPVRARRDFRVQAQNLGNTPVALALTGSDEEEALDFAFGAARLDLAPGAAQSVPLQVTRRARPGLGARETRPFTISAAAGDHAQPEVKAAGQLMAQSGLPLWLVPLVGLVLLCACVGSVFGYATLCPTLAPSAPLCPAQGVPVIRVFTITPTEVEVGGTVVVAWEVGSAETVELTSPFQNTLTGQGIESFVITQDTVFTLHASNPFGEVDRSITVKALVPTATATPTLPPGHTPPSPTPTDPPTLTPTVTQTEPPSPTPTPTPNGALGIFESDFALTVDMVFGGSLGSQRVCTPHFVTFGPGDVGKTLTVNVLDFFADAPPGDTPGAPLAGLYRSLAGEWDNDHVANLWDAPNTEEVAPAASPLTWVITAPGDYIVCLEVSANDFYGTGVDYRYVRYQLLLSGG